MPNGYRGSLTRQPQEFPDIMPKAPGWDELIAAGFRQENTLGSAAAAGFRLQGYTPNDYDPLPGLIGTRYEDYPEAFRYDQTPYDTELTKLQLDQILKDRETLARGGLSGFAASMLGGTIDPINWIPFIGSMRELRKIKGYYNRFKAGLAMSTFGGAAGAATQEIGLGAFQPYRPAEEMAINIGAGTVLAGLLGASISAIPPKLADKFLNSIAGDIYMNPPTGKVFTGGYGQGKGSLAAIEEAFEAGVIKRGTYKALRYFVEKVLPADADSSFTLRIIDAVRTITDEELAQSGYDLSKMDPAKRQIISGETIPVRAEDVAEGMEAHVTRTIIDIYRGADADTVIEEFFHRFWYLLPPERQALFQEFYAKSGSKLSVEEFFAQEGKTFFISKKLHEAIAPIRELFDRATAQLRKIFAAVRKIRQTAIPKEVEEMWMEAGRPREPGPPEVRPVSAEEFQKYLLPEPESGPPKVRQIYGDEVAQWFKDELEGPSAYALKPMSEFPPEELKDRLAKYYTRLDVIADRINWLEEQVNEKTGNWYMTKEQRAEHRRLEREHDFLWDKVERIEDYSFRTAKREVVWNNDLGEVVKRTDGIMGEQWSVEMKDGRITFAKDYNDAFRMLQQNSIRIELGLKGKLPKSYQIRPVDAKKKDLRKKEIILFHGTTLQRLEKIFRSGYFYERERPGPALSARFDNAAQYPEFPAEDEIPIVVALQVETRHLLPDPTDRRFDITLKDSLFPDTSYGSAALYDDKISIDKIRGVYFASDERQVPISELLEFPNLASKWENIQSTYQIKPAGDLLDLRTPWGQEELGRRLAPTFDELPSTDGYHEHLNFQIRAWNEEIEVEAPYIVEKIQAGKNISKADIQRYARDARRAGVSEGAIQLAVEKFEELRGIMKFSKHLAIIPIPEQEQTVVIRGAVLNTFPTAGERLERIRDVFQAIETGKKKVTLKRMIPATDKQILQAISKLPADSKMRQLLEPYLQLLTEDEFKALEVEERARTPLLSAKPSESNVRIVNDVVYGKMKPARQAAIPAVRIAGTGKPIKGRLVVAGDHPLAGRAVRIMSDQEYQALPEPDRAKVMTLERTRKPGQTRTYARALPKEKRAEIESIVKANQGAKEYKKDLAKLEELFRESIDIPIPAAIQKFHVRPFANLPITMKDFQDPRPDDWNYPICVTGNPHIINFKRPHPSWDPYIKVVRVKPVLHGSDAHHKAVAKAINYANEVGAKILITTFRSKQLWPLAQFTKGIVPLKEEDPDFLKYWTPNDPEKKPADPRRWVDWPEYLPKQRAKDAFKDAGWKTKKELYGHGGTWWWPNTKALDPELLDMIDPQTKVNYCDLLNKGCPACRNCQKLTYPDAPHAPIYGLTDEPFCAHGCPMCFVRNDERAGVKGRLSPILGKNAKQAGYGKKLISEMLEQTINIFQRVMQDPREAELAGELPKFMDWDHEKQVDFTMDMFMRGKIDADEFNTIQNELLERWRVTPEEQGSFQIRQLYESLADLPEGANPDQVSRPDWIPEYLWKKIAGPHPGLRLLIGKHLSGVPILTNQLVSTPEYLWKNWAGMPGTPDNAEVTIKRDRVRYHARFRDGYWGNYWKMRQRMAGETVTGEYTQRGLLKDKLFQRKQIQQWRQDVYDCLRELSAGKAITGEGFSKQYEPEVIAAAKAIGQVLNEVGKRADAAKILPGNMGELLSLGHVHIPRIWKHGAVRKFRAKLRQILINHHQGEDLPFMDTPRQGPPAPGTKAPKPEEPWNPDQAIDGIMQSPSGYLGVEIKSDNPLDAGKAQFLHRKELDIDDDKLTGVVIEGPDGKPMSIDFIETDPEKIMQRYLQAMMPDIVLAEKFGGDITLTIPLQAIADDATAQIKALGDTPDAKKYNEIIQERDDALRDLIALRDIIRGDYHPGGKPNYEYLANRVPGLVKTMNAMLMLGGVTISSLGDITRAMFHWGLSPYRTEMAKFFKAWNTEGMKKWRHDVVHILGVAAEMDVDGRYNAMADLDDPTSGVYAFERFINSAGGHMGLVTGIDWWNSRMKLFSTFIAQHAVLDVADKLRAAVDSGKLTDLANIVEAGKHVENPRWLVEIARMGLSMEDLVAISREINRPGVGEKIDGLILPRSDKWTNQQLANKFSAALAQEADNLIVTPGAGDKSLWMHWRLGEIISQFKSYPMAAMRRIVIAGIQNPSQEMGLGILFSTMMGGFVYTVKSLERGELPAYDEPEQFLYESIDRAGLFGYLLDVNNYIEKVTGDTLGIRPIAGLAGLDLSPTSRSRYQQDIVDLALGPTGTTARAAHRTLVGTIPGMATLPFGGGPSASDINQTYKLLWYSRVFGIRQVSEWLRAQAVEYMAAEAPSKRTEKMKKAEGF